MAYLKINDIDFSMYVKELKVTNSVNYNAQTNAHGDTVVDYINKKRVIDITIIPLTQDRAKTVLQEVDKFNVSISFLNPNTGLLESNVKCIVESVESSYYTIQKNNVRMNEFSISFIEL